MQYLDVGRQNANRYENTLLFRERTAVKPEYDHQNHCRCLYVSRGWQLYMG